MGLNLSKVVFDEWKKNRIDKYDISDFDEILVHNIGKKESFGKTIVENNDYPRVGTYASYSLFIYFIEFLTNNDIRDELEEYDFQEKFALTELAKKFDPGKNIIKYANHFTEINDSDTLFLPLLFENPFSFKDNYVASIQAACIALEEFSKILGFDL